MQIRIINLRAVRRTREGTVLTAKENRLPMQMQRRRIYNGGKNAEQDSLPEVVEDEKQINFSDDTAQHGLSEGVDKVAAQSGLAQGDEDTEQDCLTEADDDTEQDGLGQGDDEDAEQVGLPDNDEVAAVVCEPWA